MREGDAHDGRADRDECILEDLDGLREGSVMEARRWHDRRLPRPLATLRPRCSLAVAFVAVVYQDARANAYSGGAGMTSADQDESGTLRPATGDGPPCGASVSAGSSSG